MVNNFQRPGVISNADVGSDFEKMAQEWWFLNKGIRLQRNYRVRVGLAKKKERKFDLGSNDPRVLVECKSHKWTGGGNVPSAKITVWNEAMYYFLLAPPGFARFCSCSGTSAKGGERASLSTMSGTTAI